MARMDSYDAVMMEHRLRSEHADRIGWLMQAASESAKAHPRRIDRVRMVLAVALAAVALGAGAARAASSAPGATTTCGTQELVAPLSGDAWASTRVLPGRPYERAPHSDAG